MFKMSLIKLGIINKEMCVDLVNFVLLNLNLLCCSELRLSTPVICYSLKHGPL